jgi:histidine triad (HIT) family protein
MTTLFTKIINGEVPAEKIFENDRILVIKDIKPVASVHLLIISKKEIPNLQSVSSLDLPLISEIISIAQEMAIKFEITDCYRLTTNNGLDAGQTIFHLHFHLIGGRQLGAIA